MSKYPVEIGDDEGVAAGLNYLLSGPAGLGQYFDGNSYELKTLTGFARPPYYSDVPGWSITYPINVPPISLSTAEMLDERTFKYTFSSSYGSSPFPPGANIVVSGVTDSTYDIWFQFIGVVECTDTYVIARSDLPYDIVSPSTGGNVSLSMMFGGYYGGTNILYTPATATVTVTGPTDRVFLSGQADLTFNVDALSISSPTTLDVKASLYRLKNNIPVNFNDPDYLLTLTPVRLYTKYFTFNYPAPTVDSQSVSAIFTSFIDKNDNTGLNYYDLSVGEYSYFIGFEFSTGIIPSQIQVTNPYSDLGTLTAQVVKQ